jgi:superfamily II DNA/RNA helicase
VLQQSFRELGVSTPVVDTLAARSIHEPFRIQALVLPDALAGLDVLAKSPTGSGKTLAFALPIVERTVAADARPSALVLVPTRELAAQVVRARLARAAQATHRRHGLRRPAAAGAGQARCRRTHHRRHTGAARGPRRAPADRPLAHSHPRPR